MTPKQRAVAFLAQHHIYPKRHRGQNFCIDANVLRKVVAVSGVGKGDTIVEVGPGLGFLTEILAQQAQRVIAVEIEKSFADHLQSVFAEDEKIEIVKDDALAYLARNHVWSKRYHLVGMIPYNITSRLLRVALENDCPPKSITFMVQKDVARRMLALPGDMNQLAVAAQYLADVKIVATVGARAFWPQPKVESAIIILRPKKTTKTEREKFFRLLHAGFAHKRKVLKNAIKSALSQELKKVERALRVVGAQENARPQDLSVEQWKHLTKLL